MSIARKSNPPPTIDPAPENPPLGLVLIPLLKGVIYREDDETAWIQVLRLQASVREYMAAINLELILDEAEGYAFCKTRPDPAPDDPTPRLPRLIARRPLSYPVSLLLVLLRRRLLEFDSSGSETRLVLSRDEIMELIRVFLPEGTNQARQHDQLGITINKIIELGFLRRLKSTGSSDGEHYEVRRILKAFVDAQWLAEFDAHLALYLTPEHPAEAQDG